MKQKIEQLITKLNKEKANVSEISKRNANNKEAYCMMFNHGKLIAFDFCVQKLKEILNLKT